MNKQLTIEPFFFCSFRVFSISLVIADYQSDEYMIIDFMIKSRIYLEEL